MRPLEASQHLRDELCWRVLQGSVVQTCADAKQAAFHDNAPATDFPAPLAEAAQHGKLPVLTGTATIA